MDHDRQWFTIARASSGLNKDVLSYAFLALFYEGLFENFSCNLLIYLDFSKGRHNSAFCLNFWFTGNFDFSVPGFPYAQLSLTVAPTFYSSGCFCANSKHSSKLCSIKGCFTISMIRVHSLRPSMWLIKNIMELFINGSVPSYRSAVALPTGTKKMF